MRKIDTLPRKSRRLAVNLLLGYAVILAEPAVAAVYDATADFSLSGNPNGVWSYGTTGTSLLGSFNLFPYTYHGGNIFLLE